LFHHNLGLFLNKRSLFINKRSLAPHRFQLNRLEILFFLILLPSCHQIALIALFKGKIGGSMVAAK